jgi:hypothetical protein
MSVGATRIWSLFPPPIRHKPAGRLTTPFETFTVAHRDPETSLAASIMILLEPAFLLPTRCGHYAAVQKASNDTVLGGKYYGTAVFLRDSGRN